MLGFFKFWFLGKVILLTPHGIDINDILTLEPKPPIQAVAGGARIRIDVQSMIPKGTNFYDGSSDKIFPEGCVTAKLSNNRKDIYQFASINKLSPVSDGSVLLTLYYNGQVPVDVNFDQIEIQAATCPLKNVKIYWDNRGHK